MKRIVGIVLSLLLCIHFFCFSAHAEAEMLIKTETKEALPGENVELDITIENNTGILAMLFQVRYDAEKLKLVEVKDGGLIEGVVLGQSYDNNPYTMLWNSASTVNFNNDGTLVTLTFHVLEGATAGKAEVELLYNPKNFYDVDLNDVTFNVVQGGIDVRSVTKPSSGRGVSGRHILEEEETVEPPAEDAKKEPDDDYEVILHDFKDVNEADWYYDSVAFVRSMGLMSGISEDEFAPQENVTRAMLVKVLHRLAGEPDYDDAAFSDVPTDSWYTKSIAWATEQRIVNGVGEGMFAPDAYITREQIAAIMYRYAVYAGYDTTTMANTDVLSYHDAESISDWATQGIQYAVGSGLIKGKSETALCPLDNATRAEISAILQRFIEMNK